MQVCWPRGVGFAIDPIIAERDQLAFFVPGLADIDVFGWIEGAVDPRWTLVESTSEGCPGGDAFGARL